MGQQIFYCDICGGQIRSSGLQSGQAFEIDNRKFCLKCGPEMLRTLPKGQFKEIFQTITTPSRPMPIVSGEGAPRTQRSPRATGSAPSPVPWIAAGVAGAILLIVFLGWALGGS